MSGGPTYLTKEGLAKLKEELKFMQTTERRRISQEIAEARAQGDLSENAEYDAAKDAQGLLEARIAKMDETIRSSRIVDESLIDTSKVFVLSIVKVKNLTVNKEFLYTLVAAEEADFSVGKISVQSPIGKALLGHKVGDVVEVAVPAGSLKLEILSIDR